MKVLVIGSEGSVGSRYCKILYEMGIDVVKYDIGDIEFPLPDFDRAIIASPTKTHFDYYCRLIHKKTSCPYLTVLPSETIMVEKPAADSIYSINQMHCKMVNNWAFMFPGKILQPGKHTIWYRKKYHGKEGFWFDTCQLHIISNGRGLMTEEDIGTMKIDDEWVMDENVENSYVRMIHSWINNPNEIWNVQDLIPELSYIIKKHEVENGQK